jgi:hypothetical protein
MLIEPPVAPYVGDEEGTYPLFTYIYTYVYVYMHINIYVYIHIYVYMYIYIYIHTYMLIEPPVAPYVGDEEGIY